MDFNNIIGFFVTLAAIAYMFMKRPKDAHNDSEDSDQDEDHEQAEKLKGFLKSLEKDMDESSDFKPSSQPEITQKKNQSYQPKKAVSQSSESKFKSNMDQYSTRNAIEDRRLKINLKNKYEGDYGEHLLSQEFKSIAHGGKSQKFYLIGYKKPSRIKKILRSLPSKKDMVLINEVLNTPKGLK